MRLLNTETLELSPPFVPNEAPDYAILSHRWHAEEITFADISNSPISQEESPVRLKAGFSKIQGACQLALKDGYSWIWIDSCNIDKSSSAELNEAINSMWKYYAESNVCYVFLADVPDTKAGWSSKFGESNWFSRGWTLQELIASPCVEFYTSDWQAIGTKFERYKEIAEITGINPEVINRVRPTYLCNVAERMSWAAHRNVTREEDEAYALLGLFDVNMPLLYGEGRRKAFIRLQEAIFNATADHTIFLFRNYGEIYRPPLLADSPACFCDTADCTLCSAQGIQDTSQMSRYDKIRATNASHTLAHESILTTITKLRYDVSTVLPLLTYEDVAHELMLFDGGTAASLATHVAVLNCTFVQFPNAAFCLVLQHLENEAYSRLMIRPAVLPQVKKFKDRIQKTKVLVFTRPDSSKEGRMNYIFTFKSMIMKVLSLQADNGSRPVVDAIILPNGDLSFQTIERTTEKFAVQIECQPSDFGRPDEVICVRLAKLQSIWAIKEISLRRSEDRLQVLFFSRAPADRCTIPLADGKSLLVALKRLPSVARPRITDRMPTFCYQVLVNYQ